MNAGAITHVLWVITAAGVMTPRAQSRSEADTKFALYRDQPETRAVYLFEYRDRGLQIVREHIREDREALPA